MAHRAEHTLVALAGLALTACFHPSGNGDTSSTTDATTHDDVTTEASTSPTSPTGIITAPTTTSDTTGVAAASSDTAVATDVATTTGSGLTTGEPDTTTGCVNCCGNGVLDPEEECDHGGFPGEACSPACQRIAYYAFVTTHTTIETSLGLLVKGLPQADGYCNDAAADAGLPGSYKAWLSTTTLTAMDRFVQTHPVPIVRPDGLPIVAMVADIYKGTLLMPLNVNEDGDALTIAVDCNGPFVWTGTTINGLKAANNCKEWTSPLMLDEGLTGLLGATDSKWTDNSGCNVTCNVEAHLYCFEQDS